MLLEDGIFHYFLTTVASVNLKESLGVTQSLFGIFESGYEKRSFSDVD